MAEDLIFREPGFYYDFLGVRTPHALYAAAAVGGAAYSGFAQPNERFLHSPRGMAGMPQCGRGGAGQIVAVELGAGWGPWLVAAYAAARRRGIRNIKLVGVEGLPEHVEMMRQHFIDNGIGRATTPSIRRRGTRDGTAGFPIWKTTWPRGARKRHSRKRSRRTVPVPCISLASLLAPFAYVDFIHCDIQGPRRV